MPAHSIYECMTTTWNETIFAGIRKVNQCLYSGQLPEKAEAMLYMMEDCLCSGDGLSPETAFRAKDERVVEKVLGMLGVKKVGGVRDDAGVTVVRVEGNVMGVNEIFFSFR